MKTDELYEIFGIKKYGIKKVSNIYFTESATRPKNIFKFLGIPVFLLFFFYLVGFRILFQKQDLILIISIVLYILFFNMVFKNYYAVRYLSPIIPLFAILAAKGIKGIQKRPIRALVIALCFVQFAAVLSFVYTQRRLTEDERAAMQYIREKTPGEIRILTNEEPLVSYYTGRPTAWVNSFSWGRKFIFYKLLWGTELEEKISILKTFKINYIYMPKHRVYDDSNVRHYGGFPLTFVNTLPKLAQIEYDNNKVTLWRVNNYPVQQD